MGKEKHNKETNSGTKKTSTPGKTEKKKNDSSKKQKELGKETLGNDYWDRVADDVASGYTTKNDDNPILNIDQEPGDDERGDEAVD